jgi:hypothetical protein
MARTTRKRESFVDSLMRFAINWKASTTNIARPGSQHGNPIYTSLLSRVTRMGLGLKILKNDTTVVDRFQTNPNEGQRMPNSHLPCISYEAPG